MSAVLFRLETAQEAELDLMMLQHAHNRVTLQQEATRVARELDQQQLFALLQQQQQAAAQEQVCWMAEGWLRAVHAELCCMPSITASCLLGYHGCCQQKKGDELQLDPIGNAAVIPATPVDTLLCLTASLFYFGLFSSNT